MAIGLVLTATGLPAAEQVRGLPFIRSFPLEEIGSAPRGARLTFDSFGRVAVVYDGVYSVLNDTVWLDMSPNEPGAAPMADVLMGRDGGGYYSGRGAWGIVEIGAKGRLNAVTDAPANAPAWALKNNFTQILSTSRGVFFAGWEGIVFLDPADGESRYFELSAISRMFSVGDQTFVSAHGQPIWRVDVESGALQMVPSKGMGSAVQCSAPLDAARTLIAAGDGPLLVFDGERLEPWAPAVRLGLRGRVTSLQQLVEGGVAVAISGRGLFLFSATGELLHSLTFPSYHRIMSLGANEPGVLWVGAEDAVEKVLYGSPLTTFGHKQGLSLSWPGVFLWNDQVIVGSGGVLYESQPAVGGAPSRFEPMKLSLPHGAWALASSGSHFLIGNAAGVFSLEQDGRLGAVSPMKDIARLVMVGAELCYAIGRSEIALFRLKDGSWVEDAPRIPGNGQPAVVHASKRAVWIEYGGNRVARVFVQDGRLRLDEIADLPWSVNQWVNVGLIDDLVVLSGPAGERIFYNEATEQRCDAPELRRLLDRSPYHLARVVKDGTGVIWASHSQGIVTFTPRDGGYDMDSSTFDLVTDHFPSVKILPGNDIWISAGKALHHVERRPAVGSSGPMRPILVSVTDRQTGVELLTPGRAAGPPHLSFAQNSLTFRFFAGSYSSRRAPAYEFRLNGSAHWTTLDTSSLLTFPGLREGRYRLEVRTQRGPKPVGPPTEFEFQIFPPWHRTGFAYVVYALCLAGAVLGIVRWTSMRARKRHAELEEIVRERTNQLKATMEKLNEETRNAATLAERQRLAGEIHDSLQQGLSGLMLQLDATLKLPVVAKDVRSRLNVARNMVSFTRHEVQHAVWDMESPLLEDTELGEALRKLTALIGSGGASIDIAVAGTPVSLPAAAKHHLLRIAQEAITNAVRHAAAERIRVELIYRADSIALTVADNGTGFPVEDVVTRSIGHFGLRGLRDRATKMGGELTIESVPGKGTSIGVVLRLVSRELDPLHATSRPA